VAVEAFLQRRIAYTAIPQVIETVLAEVSAHGAETLEQILADDAAARAAAERQVSMRSTTH